MPPLSFLYFSPHGTLSLHLFTHAQPLLPLQLKTPMPKLLADFLQERQEPFSLDVYLLERGCSRVLRRSWFCGKRQCAITNCSELVKSMLGKFAPRNSPTASSGGKNGDKGFSDSCSESGVAQCLETSQSLETASLEEEEEADAAGASKWRSAEYSDKQLSPVSVLEDTESHQDKKHKMNTTQGEASTTHQYTMNKRALRQTKRLLIDCLREVLEGKRKRDRTSREQLRQILGAEELWKLVCEHVWGWSQHSTNILHLLHIEFIDSSQEWNAGFVEKKEEISVEIGESILEAIINDILALD